MSSSVEKNLNSSSHRHSNRPWTTCHHPHPPYGHPDVHKWINRQLQLWRVTELIPQIPAAAREHAAGSVNGTIKIIDSTGPINKACFQFRAAIRLILIMGNPLFLHHCSPFSLFSPGVSHLLSARFHTGLRLRWFIELQEWRTADQCKGDRKRCVALV